MNRIQFRLSWALFAAALVILPGLALAVTPGEPDRDSPVPGAAALEARLLAPCCWVQTLDVHESEVASALRAEIRRRLLAGEHAGAIEEDLVARHGERIRAVDKAGDLRGVIPLIAIAVSGLVGLGFLSWLRRRTARAPVQAAPATEVRDIYDDRLDEELREIDV